VKSEVCGLSAGVAVASDMARSWRAKVIGALNFRFLGRAAGWSSAPRAMERRPVVATPPGLDPSALRSAPTLEPSEGEQEKRYAKRPDRVLEGDVSGARFEPREKRGKAARWNEPIHGGGGKEEDAEKSSDQRHGSIHRTNVPFFIADCDDRHGVFARLSSKANRDSSIAICR
jgi:hypothetical protein